MVLIANISLSSSFELNSDVLGDPSHLLDSSARTSSPSWPVNSTIGGDGEFGEPSHHQGEEPADLAKELLGQQCEELREELDLKDRELDILRDEVSKSAQDLEEARSR